LGVKIFDVVGNQERIVDLSESKDAVEEFVVEASVPLRGVVVDKSGVPQAGVDVRVKEVMSTDWVSRMRDDVGPWVGRATTDGNGAFVVKRCPPSVLMAIAVRGESVVGFLSGIQRGDRNVKIVVQSSEAASGRLTAEIRRADGEDVSGMLVSIFNRNHYRRSKTVRLKEDGVLDLSVPVGVYELVVAGVGTCIMRHGPFEVASSRLTATGVLVVGKGGRIRIKVTGANSHLVNAIIILDGNGRKIGNAIVGRDGCALSYALPRGRYAVSSMGSVATRPEVCSVNIGEITDVNIRTEAYSVVRVYGSTGGSGMLSRRWIDIKVMRGDELIARRSVLSGLTGTWNMRIGLKPGNYSVLAEPAGGVRESFQMEVLPGSERVLVSAR
jgi:hypothetical protein